MFKKKNLLIFALCASLLNPLPTALAAPKGGKVVGGKAQIKQAAGATTINQTSDRAIINWNSFDIGKTESVQHNMPSSNSAGLHRVVGGGGASQIEGLLQSNGNIYVVNPAGVVIHNGAKIDVNGFIATTRDIANENFMKGNMVFDKAGNSGAAIINQGNITLKDNGLAALVAPTVRNDGIIAGKLGKVALGGSEAAWKLDLTGDDLIAFTMDEKSVNELRAKDGTPLASVQNNGQIKAEGGVVLLSAAQLDGIVGSVVNNGEVSAASVEAKGGKIIFRGQGDQVDVINKGSIDVSSQKAEGGLVRVIGQANVVNAGVINASGDKGGNVVVTGSDVTLKSGSKIDASGQTGGGTVLVGGNARGKGPEPNAKTVTVQTDAEILADAKLKGNGGQVVVWADEKTQFDGKITARGGENGGDGGFVETSAKLLIIGDPALVNTSAKKGQAGTWLLDPEDFVIAASGGDITGSTVSKNLENNNFSIISDNNIIIDDDIEWDADTILSIIANKYIAIHSAIVSKGNNSGVLLSFDTYDGLWRPDDKRQFDLRSGKITLLGDNPQLIINDKEYKLIKNIDDLATIGNSEDIKNYALTRDIDCSQVNNLLDFLGFDDGVAFEGNFTGLGNTIKNINIKSDGDLYCGLFPRLNLISTISDLNIVNANIEVSGNYGGVGILSGSNGGMIYNVHVSGNIVGERCRRVGGLTGVGGYITDCSANVNININNKGYNDGAAIGGLVGTASKILFSYSNANIIYRQDIANVKPEENIFKYAAVGGLIGSGYSNLYSNCYSIGNIQSIGNEIFTGGFIGKANMSEIYNSYASVKITGNKAGGFAGMLYIPIYTGLQKVGIFNCKWDTTTSKLDQAINYVGEETSDPELYKIIGLDNKQMRRESSFNDWDFQKIWTINEGKNYPELRGIANNQIILPEQPIDPTPPDNPDPVEPDPVEPDPTPDPDPNPNPTPEPEQPGITDPDPSTPTDPGTSTPSNPEDSGNSGSSGNSNSGSTTPSNPGNSGGSNSGSVTPSNPGNSGSNNSTPSTPSNPSTSNPGNSNNSNSGNSGSSNNSTPSTPSNPGTSTPANPGNSGGSNSGNSSSNNNASSNQGNSNANNSTPSNNSNQNNSTAPQYKLIKDNNGIVHVWLDNQYLGTLDKNSKDFNIIPTEVTEDINDNITNENDTNKENSSTDVNQDNEENTLPKFSSSNTHERKITDKEFISELGDYIDSVIQYIGEEIFNSLYDQAAAEKEGIDAIKKQIITSPNVLKGNAKQSDVVPDEVYKAFAEMVYDSIGSSKIENYEKDINKFLQQFCKSLLGGTKNIEKTIPIDGIVYTISNNTMGYDGNGIALATVTWKDPESNATKSMVLSFASSPGDTAKALADYNAALKNMVSEEYREAIAYFIGDLIDMPKDKARKYVDYGEKIFNAMVDPEKAKELVKEIGDKFADKYSGKIFGFIGNNFTDFITKALDVGNKIGEIANKLEKVKNEYNDIKKLYEAGKKLSETEAKDLLKSIDAINDLYKQGSVKADAIVKYLQL